MNARAESKLPAEPPPRVMEALREKLSGHDQQAIGAVFAVRKTAQQMDNVVTGWMSDTAGTPARFQILMLIWATKGHGVPHKEIVAALGVSRATVSGLMGALERDGLVKSIVDLDDRRNLLASLTPKGLSVVERAFETNAARLHAAFDALSSDELATFAALLQRIRQGFMKKGVAGNAGDARREADTPRAVEAETAHASG